jgi:hypothetical protein
MRPRHCELFAGRVGCELTLVEETVPHCHRGFVLLLHEFRYDQIDAIKQCRSHSVTAIHNINSVSSIYVESR